MKKLILLITIVLIHSLYAQPDYELELKNDQQTSGTEYEFDIVIRPKAPTTSLELAQLQLIMTFNTAITSGTLSFLVISSTSDLVASQQPQQSNLSISGNELRIFPETPPRLGNGTIVNSEKRVARFRLSSTTTFNNVSAGIAWKNSVDPITKVWAYVSGSNTNITNSINHLNLLSDPPLPVELVSFTAKVRNDKVLLNWNTATEVDNHGFDILRSIKTNNWEKIGFVEGCGNSNSPKYYSFTDNNPFGGNKFRYKLKQIDTDGTFSYSSVAEVEIILDEYQLLQNYPNPFNPTTNIKFTIPEDGYVKLNVYTLLGEKAQTLINENMNAGYHRVTFNPIGLISGIYIYRLEVNDFVEIRKMIYLK